MLLSFKRGWTLFFAFLLTSLLELAVLALPTAGPEFSETYELAPAPTGHYRPYDISPDGESFIIRVEGSKIIRKRTTGTYDSMKRLERREPKIHISNKVKNAFKKIGNLFKKIPIIGAISNAVNTAKSVVNGIKHKVQEHKCKKNGKC